MKAGTDGCGRLQEDLVRYAMSTPTVIGLACLHSMDTDSLQHHSPWALLLLRKCMGFCCVKRSLPQCTCSLLVGNATVVVTDMSTCNLHPHISGWGDCQQQQTHAHVLLAPKADVSCACCRSEEQRLEISRALIDFQMETNEAKQEWTNTK
jgi:hypothetical protein